jgi:hypothetical protein
MCQDHFSADLIRIDTQPPEISGAKSPCSRNTIILGPSFAADMQFISSTLQVCQRSARVQHIQLQPVRIAKLRKPFHDVIAGFGK